jgi:CubicO group peptidase (beta-lactamase class C family)
MKNSCDRNRGLISRRGFLKSSAAWALACGFSLTPTKAIAGLEDLSDLLIPVRQQFGVPALAGAFGLGEGLVALGAVGRRRADQADPAVQRDDQFHIGSNTKSMTATIIATLVEQGMLAWDTAIADVYPELVGTIQPDYEDVTLLELLSHRSGIADLPAFHDRAWTLTGPLPEQRYTMVQMVLAVPPAAPPGSAYMYSNWGYVTAGAMAERVTGEAWEDLITERLFAPLGMDSAGFGAPGTAELVDEPWGHSGSGYTPVPPGRFADNPPVYGPAGTVHCSLSDFAVHGALHVRGDRGEKGLLLTPDSFRILHTDWYNQGYALGWAVTNRSWAGGRVLTHNGSNTYWYHDTWLAPARDAVLITATNCGYNGFEACDAVLGPIIRRYLP